MIEIDGSRGEGGGQIIRSSLALSAVTGKAFTVSNVRAGRSKPGLKRQHVTCCKAARDICNATVDGDELNSSKLIFQPGKIKPGQFHFQIGTAGSSSLVMQTVLPALMLADAPSSVTVEGGTHNMGGPPLDFLQRVYLPQVEKMGPKFSVDVESLGFFPVGGGKFTVNIQPKSIGAKLKGLQITKREQALKATITALVSQLPLHIAEREIDIIRRKREWNPTSNAVEIKNSPGPGNVVMLELDSGNVNEIVTGFGKKGVKAEKVARGVFREAKPYIEGTFPVGEYLADQLMLPMGLAAANGQESRFVTGELSLHSTTHIDILKLFLDISIETESRDDGSTEVVISPNH